MRLYHYSDKDFNGKIEPRFFGENNFTSYSKELSEFKRIHFYIDKNNREYFFNGCRFLYIAEISKKYIYDLEKDHLKCNGNFNTVTDFFRFLIKRGYKGFAEFTGHNVVVIFQAVKIKRQVRLTY